MIIKQTILGIIRSNVVIKYKRVRIMYELKTKETDENVVEFLNKIEHPRKREDGFKLLEIFTEATGLEAKMWGPSIIGFGTYHYKYASGHEGDAPIVGFSPRKAKISLYLYYPSELKEYLKNFGKHTTSKACIYINKLEDIDTNILKEMIVESVILTKEMWKEYNLEYLFVSYPKCSTCKKAKKFLTENNIKFTERDIKEDNPTKAELKNWLGKSNYTIKRFFNTSGTLYREMKLKDKLVDMTEEEKLELLSTDGMLVRRPIVVGPDTVLVGFKEDEWRENLLEMNQS